VAEDVTASRRREGDPLFEWYVYHSWLFLIAAVILLGCAARRTEHHHAAGRGFLLLLCAYPGGVGLAWIIAYARKKELFDRSPKASTAWRIGYWTVVPAAAIVAWLLGANGGTGIAVASLVYIAMIIAQATLARDRVR
jgi:hypothetical protein